jgi:signal transduction histidine kinase
MTRRWRRLDIEGTLLLFLDANPAVLRVVVRDGVGELLVVVGRQDGAPQVLPPEATFLESSRPGPPPLRGDWPVGGEGAAGRAEAARLEAWVAPRDMLRLVAPGLEDRLRLVPTERFDGDPPVLVDGAGGEPADRLTVAVPMVDERWNPPVRCWVVRTEDGSRLVRSIEALAGRYRTTVVVNLGVVALTLVLGTLALRQLRQVARLEAERQQQARVRQLERQLMHSERLAGVGRLAAGMAHEINNPLEGMANYLGLLREDLEKGDTTAAARQVERLGEGLERAAGITRQVLTFSDPGRAPKAPLDLVEVARESATFVAANPTFQSITLEVEAEQAPLWVEGNRITLGQLFLNLLLNACEAQPEGGRVAVRAGRRDGRAWVAVADRGPGLDPEIREHLFEPFFSGHDSSGLGLAVCHGIVRDHGGEIQGQNQPGGGAIFEVTLPLAEAAP